MALTQTGGLAHFAPSFPALFVQEGRLFKMPGDRSEGNQSYGCSSQGANSATASTKQALLSSSTNSEAKQEQTMFVVSAAISREKSAEDKHHNRDGSSSFINLPDLHYSLAKEEHKSLLTSCNPLPGDLSRGLDTGAGPPTQSLAH